MATTTNLQLVITAKDNASSVISSVGNKFSTFGNSIKNVADTIAKATLIVGGFSVAIGTKAVQASMKFENALLGLSSVAKAFNVDQNKATEAAKKLAEDGLMSVTDAAAGLKNLLASRFSLDEAITLMNAFKDSAAFGRQGALDFGQAIIGATEGIKNGNSILVDNAGITKNLSVILEEAGFSAQDLMKATTDLSVRQAIYNGILKEASIFQGDAGRSAGTTSGAFAKLNTSVNNLMVAIGKELNPYVLEMVNRLNGATDSSMTLVPQLANIFQNIGKITLFLIDNYKWILLVVGAYASFKIAAASVGVITVAIQGLTIAFGFLTTISAPWLIGGAVVAGLVAGAYFVYKNWDSIVKNMKSLFTGLWDSIGNVFSSIGTYIIDKLKPVIDFVNRAIAGYNKIASKAGKSTISEIRYNAKQFGGAVSTGTPYIVGEHRPEVFVPSQSGNIRQMDQAGGKTVNVTFNNVSVRDDYDLDRIIMAVKDTLARDQKMASFGIRTT